MFFHFDHLLIVCRILLILFSAKLGDTILLLVTTNDVLYLSCIYCKETFSASLKSMLSSLQAAKKNIMNIPDTNENKIFLILYRIIFLLFYKLRELI